MPSMWLLLWWRLIVDWILCCCYFALVYLTCVCAGAEFSVNELRIDVHSVVDIRMIGRLWLLQHIRTYRKFNSTIINLSFPSIHVLTRAYKNRVSYLKLTKKNSAQSSSGVSVDRIRAYNFLSCSLPFSLYLSFYLTWPTRKTTSNENCHTQNSFHPEMRFFLSIFSLHFCCALFSISC